MGYVLSKEAFDGVLRELGRTYRLYAPVCKRGEGRFTDTHVIRYDFIKSVDDIELKLRSDFAFKEILTPLSETLFFFTEETVKEAHRDDRDVLVFLRSCDMHALRRLDDMFLRNGSVEDWFYRRARERVKFVLMGCCSSFEDCFCVDMKSNRTTEGYSFSIDEEGGTFRCDVRDASLEAFFAQAAADVEEVTPRYVTENSVRVTVPQEIPNSVYRSPMWDEYTARCIGCGRCNFVCPTCTCWTMQDVFYTDNGKVGERRRVAASCMVDGYTNVAGGGQYRRTHGERMRFKVLHKVYDHRRRFGYDMCVGCGRCDAVCPEYISFSESINKLNRAVREG